MFEKSEHFNFQCFFPDSFLVSLSPPTPSQFVSLLIIIKLSIFSCKAITHKQTNVTEKIIRVQIDR